MNIPLKMKMHLKKWQQIQGSTNPVEVFFIRVVCFWAANRIMHQASLKSNVKRAAILSIQKPYINAYYSEEKPLA